jgi:TatD DNase family protein
MSRQFPIYDAHNHLQDPRLHPENEVVAGLEALPISKAVVNGTRPEDWAAVTELARKYKWVIPSYGLHPWYVNQPCENWIEQLDSRLRAETAAVGEIGLDRWIENHDTPRQEEAFIWQLRLAAKLERPVTIHCLKAFGRMLEILQSEKLPAGFLLHSYGGPAEMIQRFAEVGGYFSISGYFALERKKRQREVFRKVPLDRILIETDAPDMALPAERDRYKISGTDGEVINHPANIIAVYNFAAELYGIPLEEFADRVAQNFVRFFGPVLQ